MSLLVAVAGVVVVDLVIVPRDDERRRGMRRHQIRIGLVLRVAVAVVDERVDLLPLMLAHAAGVAAAVAAALVDVVAGVEDEVELLLGDPAVRGEVAGLVVAAAADARSAADRRPHPAAGAVFVRPIWLISSPARKRYQYSRPGSSPVDFDVHAVAELGPRDRRALCAIGPERASAAISHCTSTLAIGMPPPSSGSGASRVQSTTPSGSGSPEATPSVNG